MCGAGGRIESKNKGERPILLSLNLLIRLRSGLWLWEGFKMSLEFNL